MTRRLVRISRHFVRLDMNLLRHNDTTTFLRHSAFSISVAQDVLIAAPRCSLRDREGMGGTALATCVESAARTTFVALELVALSLCWRRATEERAEAQLPCASPHKWLDNRQIRHDDGDKGLTASPGTAGDGAIWTSL